MKDFKARLDGSYGLVRFRRFRNRLFAIESAVLLLLAAGVLVLMGASLKPFYIPMDFLILMGLLLVLVLLVEFIYLRTIEIKALRSTSGKYLMARNMFRACLALAAAALIVLVVFMLPQVMAEIAKNESIKDSIRLEPSGEPNDNATIVLMTRNSLGTMDAEMLTLSSNGEAEIDIYVDGTRSISDTGTYQVGSMYPGYHNITIVVRNTASTPISVDYEMTYTVSSLLRVFAPLVGIGIIVAAMLGAAAMYPLREKYAAASIYSRSYVEHLGTGVRSIDEKALDKTLTAEEIVEELEQPTPAPEPPPAAAQEAPKPMARSKGVVDLPGAEAEDVPCPSCGAMNSPDAGMCFSCGAVLVAKEAPRITAEDLMERSRRFLDGGRYDDALDCLDRVLRESHEHLDALFMKAQALRMMGRRELAVQYLNTVIQAEPKHRAALLERGRALEEMEHYERALESYAAAAEHGVEEAAERVRALQAAMKDETLAQFMLIPGIGQAKANALYDAGFKTVRMLSEASVEDLMRAKGISERLARRVLKHFGKE
ncbi:MAG: helix-hairpin-helix domain-containing protein [Candidatus Thermoplasmatota archaeon]